MTVLLLSEQMDYHGLAVQWGLGKLGIECDFWNRTLFPARQAMTLTADDTVHFAAEQIPSMVPGRYRAIWNRRGSVPTISPELHRTDAEFARVESLFALGCAVSLLERLNPEALLVNPSVNKTRADFKMLQIHMAKLAGFEVPPTICSNDPVVVRAFHSDMLGRGVVAKAHQPSVWRTESNRLHFLCVSRVDEKDLADDKAIAAAPMLYQMELDIRYEVRATVFGENIFAVRYVRTNEHKASGTLDIKSESPPMEAFELPAAVREKCLRYMEVAGLTFAAFDLGVLPGGEFVFIEANEAGQFLFQEDQGTGLPMLDAFCKFLVSGSSRYVYSRDESKVRLDLDDFHASDVAQRFIERLKESRASGERKPFELRE